MPLEIEIKLRVESLDSVRHTLTALKARRVGMVREQNIFFDRPDRSLLANHSGLRVRLSWAAGKKEPAALITFKGPPQKEGLRSREAYDLHVSPQEQAIPMVEALGFERTLSFEKYRESWRMDGCLIELDELPQLGMFLEIEGPSEVQVLAVREKLGLGEHPAVKESYIAMVDARLKGSGTRDLTF